MKRLTISQFIGTLSEIWDEYGDMNIYIVDHDGSLKSPAAITHEENEEVPGEHGRVPGNIYDKTVCLIL